MAAVTSDSKNVIECKICKNQYRNQQLFDDHLKNNPACSKLTCDVCQKQYMYVKSLNFHKKTHLKEKPFKCDECEYSTISKSLLNRHQLTHSRKLLYNCKYCGWPTSRKSTLDGHIFVVHYEQLSSPDELPPRYRDLKKYSCKLCKQRCQSEYALKEHMRTHTGERPFQCDICLRKYVTKSNLKVHMRAKHSRQKFTSEQHRREETSQRIATSGQNIAQSHMHFPASISSTEEIEETEDPEILTAVGLISRRRLEMMMKKKEFFNLDKPSTSK
ncbi:zinc finger protein 717-like isoform X2 [Centruroides sculpturatus]|uniref:zinc finger protein 717-like isoform X2 n=1 Tax=Centruroides sculpturatus TaxID=218467 RepID=UPI000C6DE662|nr:zinc finger protein 717-like isoform X2 [Centruroides sculpturatus]